MRRLVLGWLFLVLAPSAGDAGPPAVPLDAVLRPMFITSEGEFTAGTMSLVSVPGRSEPLYLSAHHLMGPNGGLSRQYDPPELGGLVREVRVRAIANPSSVYETGPLVAIPEARPYGVSPGVDLLALSAGPGRRPPSLVLSSAPIEKGSSAWLFAEVYDGAEEGVLLHHAIIEATKPDAMILRFSNSGLNLRATSGAPILNKAGEVIGLNVSLARGSGVRSIAITSSAIAGALK